ncbi:MAG: hypothetical protein HZC29_06300, partial [Thaumarchaeota archaeon]|nr:hypothetical protein [Nitrososphaerota archaeon]
GNAVNPRDVALSTYPWVVGYEKGTNEKDTNCVPSYGGPPCVEGQIDPPQFVNEKAGDILTSITSQALRSRNIYDVNMINTTGTSSCELRRLATSQPQARYRQLSDMYGSIIRQVDYYNILSSKYIYLFKYRQQGLGTNCAIDQNTKLPQLRTYGWCQSCTQSTLAYQNITALPKPYLPVYTQKIDNLIPENTENICKVKYDTAQTTQVGFVNVYLTADNVSCFNPKITDVSDYKETLGYQGSPRTIPEATIIKERIGNYLKSGIMPVFDISDPSNWNQANPDFGSGRFPAEARNYSKYDFESLFGQSGAVIAIVDHISGQADQTKREEIIERSRIVKSRCIGCIVAFHVDSPPDNQSFGQTINSVLSDPRANFNVDMVTFDYSILDHAQQIGNWTNVAADIAGYGRVSLQTKGKPTLVVGLNYEDNTARLALRSFEYDQIFSSLALNQDELVKAGVIGVIYTPARETNQNRKGLLDVGPNANGIGTKTPKFCSFENTMQLMTAEQPVAIFTKTITVPAMNCTACTSLEIANNQCGMACDNGVQCDIPAGSGLVPGNSKCPEGTVVDSCTPCTQMTGTYTCNIKYSNGTISTIGPSAISSLDSDLYLDVIGSLPKPNKCCLVDSRSGQNYSYSKQSYQNSINKPIAFPKTGDPNVDCGFGSLNATKQLSSFCGIQLPIRDYDISCTVSQAGPGQ